MDKERAHAKNREDIHDVFRVYVKAKQTSSCNETCKPKLLEEKKIVKMVRDPVQPARLPNKVVSCVNNDSLAHVNVQNNNKKMQKESALSSAFTHKSFKRKKVLRKSYSFFPGMLSILGAVGLGVVMGLSILSLFFSGNPHKVSTTIDSHLSRGTHVSIPPLQVTMLQAGSFMDQKGAQQAVQELKLKGFTSVISKTAPFRVYIGIGNRDAEAKRLASIYKEKNVDVYLKEYTLAKDISFSGNPQKLMHLINSSHTLVELLSTFSGQTIQSEGAALANDITKNYSEYEAAAVQTSKYLTPAAQKSLEEMNNHLSLIVQKVSSKQEKGVSVQELQGGLVSYVNAYERFLSELPQA